MEKSDYMRMFLLFVSIANAYCGIYFKKEDETVTLYFPEWGDRVDYTVSYRIHEDGPDLLLVNCSQPHSPSPEGYNITCDPGWSNLRQTFRIKRFSQTGRYRLEGWRQGNITRREDFHLIVCAQRLTRGPPPCPVSSEKVAGVESVELCRLNVTLGNGTSLRVYRYGDSPLVLDTSTSLEPLVEDLKGRLQLDLNPSRVTLLGMSTAWFSCTIWRENQCQSYSDAPGEYIGHVFAHEGKDVTLPCILNQKAQDKSWVQWSTPTADVITGQASPQNMSHPQQVTRPQEVMHMLNGSQSGNYSLIIPVVSKRHSGKYSCQTGLFSLTNIDLTICPQSLPLDVLYSDGDNVSVVLPLNDTDDTRSHVNWYRQTDLHSEEELLYPVDGFVEALGQLRGRMCVNRHSHTLTISNLTAEDGAVFTWRRFPLDRLRCMEGSVRLVYSDALEEGSLLHRVYGPLLGCVVLGLGLVAAGVWVTARKGAGEEESVQTQHASEHAECV